MSILFCKISLLDSTEKDGYHTWKWLLSARLSPSEREQHFQILKYKRWVKNCLVTLEDARVRHAKQPWKDVSGRAWGSRSTILNYCVPLLAFGHFFFFFFCLWSLQDGRWLIIDYSNLQLSIPLSTEPFWSPQSVSVSVPQTLAEALLGEHFVTFLPCLY